MKEHLIRWTSGGRAPGGAMEDGAIGKVRLAGFAAFAGCVTAVFGPDLARFFRYAFGTEIHSHVVLIPAVVGWLLWTGRGARRDGFGTSVAGGVVCGGAGVLGLLGLSAQTPFIGGVAPDKYPLMVASYLCLLAAGAFLFLGGSWMKRAAFPVFFLVFMIPLPDGLVAGIEKGLVLASAEVAGWLFSLSGTPVFREGAEFHLPGFSLAVAQECSGIRSSWVLLIVSLLASHLFLRSHGRRALVVALVIPLGIVRNGFRILVVGLLCVDRGPHAIDHWIHRHGGPVFFALSLVPLFVLLWWLRRGEERGGDAVPKENSRS